MTTVHDARVRVCLRVCKRLHVVLSSFSGSKLSSQAGALCHSRDLAHVCTYKKRCSNHSLSQSQSPLPCLSKQVVSNVSKYVSKQVSK